jgi:hypothetical protein
VVTMCRGVTWSGGSNGAGKTLKEYTVRWRIPGQCTRIQIALRDYWSEDHESESVNQETRTFRDGCWSRVTARRQRRTESCAHVWHAAVHLGKREDRREEAVGARFG